MPKPPEDRTDLEVEVHSDGSATVYLPQGENLDRVSACVRCMLAGDLEGEDNDPTIGDEAYAQIWDGICNTVVHERCVREGDVVRKRVPAR